MLSAAAPWLRPIFGTIAAQQCGRGGTEHVGSGDSPSVGRHDWRLRILCSLTFGGRDEVEDSGNIFFEVDSVNGQVFFRLPGTAPLAVARFLLSASGVAIGRAVRQDILCGAALQLGAVENYLDQHYFVSSFNLEPISLPQQHIHVKSSSCEIQLHN